MKKRMLGMMVVVVMVAGLVTGCGTKDKSTNTGSTGKSYTIGISQFAEHPSLDNCRKGFLEGLKEAGIEEGKNLTVEYKNSEAETGTANQIAQNFVSKKVDLICAIATPSAQSAYNACLNSNIPVVFTAVTDPVAAKLAKADFTPCGNVTGTSDKLAVEDQLKMIRKILPDAKTIGIMYTTSEVNSESAIKEYKAAVGKYGFKLEAVGVNTISDIPLAADHILSKVDCLNNLTDNTVVSALPTILDKANKKKIPVFGSEVEQVKKGCLASQGIDYVSLGKQTGEMAAKVLKGEKKASELKYEQIKKSELYVNQKVADNIGIKMDKEIVSKAAEVFDQITK